MNEAIYKMADLRNCPCARCKHWDDWIDVEPCLACSNASIDWPAFKADDLAEG